MALKDRLLTRPVAEAMQHRRAAVQHRHRGRRHYLLAVALRYLINVINKMNIS